MRTALRTATVLTWFNLIFWGLFTVLGLLSALSGTGGLLGLLSIILLAAIPLNAYASLKLQAAIRRPGIPLGHQTPVGIRFVGFVALFFGIGCVTNGIGIMGNPKEFMDAFRDQLSQYLSQSAPSSSSNNEFMQYVTHHGTPQLARQVGTAVVMLGLAVVINVVLNLRLLRWYYLQQNKGS